MPELTRLQTRDSNEFLLANANTRSYIVSLYNITGTIVGAVRLIRFVSGRF
jgi:hypothetical protein